MSSLRLLIAYFFIICCHQTRFCIWQARKMSKISPKAIYSAPKQIITEPYIVKASQDIKSQISLEAKFYMNKHAQFRSYHPHYLHSYSYPEPISSHIYIGQVVGNNPVFYIKDNQTFNRNNVVDRTNDIFYINRKRIIQNRDHINKQAYLKTNKTQHIMAFQIQNMLSIDMKTQIMVYNFKDFLGIICDLGQGDFHSFLFYISKSGKQIISFSELPADITFILRNQSLYDSRSAWMNAQRIRLTRGKGVNLSGQELKPLFFSNLIIELGLLSSKAVQSYKFCLNQFSKEQDNETISQILVRMNKVKISTYEYRFDIQQENAKAITCDSQAENQILRGISYEYGTLILKNGSKKIDNQPRQLLSFTPSRKRFPWGFLWDDGFHCQIAIRNQEMAQIGIQVIKSWLDTMNEDGWIPRQQNRGSERQFLCSCPQFMSKDVRDGNPPTLMLPLHFLAKKKILNYQNFPKKYYNKLKKWYQWFFETQQTSKSSFIFRWHDSIPNSGSFNSGLDDFPRIPDSFGHIDCQSWMYLFSQAMVDISFSLQEDGFIYLENAQKIKQAFKQNFIEPNTNLPKDYVLVREKKVYSPHFGYPSILPIAFGMIDESSQQFIQTMSAVKSELDSGKGLSSISSKSRQYLSNPDAYWRGPVWININYLFLKGLYENYPSQLSYYHKVRLNLIEMVCGNWQQSGYFYQNYIKGKGSFSYPFTGWTALISIIIKENY